MTHVRLPKPLTPDELERVIEVSCPEVAALVELLAETGLRLAEVTSITAAEARTWPRAPRWCRRSWCGRHSTTTTIIGKGDRQRVVMVSPTALRASRVLLDHPAERIRRDFLVPWGPRRIQELVSDAGRSAGLACWPHRLRHTFATRLIESGVPIEITADLMGHGSPGTTLVYWKASKNVKARAMRKRRRRW